MNTGNFNDYISVESNVEQWMVIMNDNVKSTDNNIITSMNIPQNYEPGCVHKNGDTVMKEKILWSFHCCFNLLHLLSFSDMKMQVKEALTIVKKSIETSILNEPMANHKLWFKIYFASVHKFICQTMFLYPSSYLLLTFHCFI